MKKNVEPSFKWFGLNDTVNNFCKTCQDIIFINSSKVLKAELKMPTNVDGECISSVSKGCH